MVELKLGMPVWHRDAAADAWQQWAFGMDRTYYSPLDPASSAGQALAALELAAQVPGTTRWHGNRASLRLVSDEYRVNVFFGLSFGRGDTAPAAVAALRDQLEAAAVAAWGREHA